VICCIKFVNYGREVIELMVISIRTKIVSLSVFNHLRSWDQFFVYCSLTAFISSLNLSAMLWNKRQLTTHLLAYWLHSLLTHLLCTALKWNWAFAKILQLLLQTCKLFGSVYRVLKQPQPSASAEQLLV
jgi:hypothetical protein